MKKFLAGLSIVVIVSTSFYRRTQTNQKDFSQQTLTIENQINKVDSVAISTVGKEESIYSKIKFDGNVLKSDVFEKAYKGFLSLKKSGELPENAHILSVCDFSLSSNSKRLWVIDLNESKVLFNSLVAHGKNTGEEFAEHFSNTENSLQSSIGFYITKDTYQGDNGYSLRLEGMDLGFNDNAMQRSIVMHGADYVSDDFAIQHQRIGRSWGCPAIPRNLAEPIINSLKNNTCLFIYFPDENYLKSSKWLN